MKIKILSILIAICGAILIGLQNPYILIGFGMILLGNNILLDENIKKNKQNIEEVWTHLENSNKTDVSDINDCEEKTLTVMGDFKNLGDSFRNLANGLYCEKERGKNNE